MVPQIATETPAMVPQIQKAEYIKQVPVQQVQEVPKYIEKVETRAVEKIVPVQQNLIHEIAVEVPQVSVHEVLTQVPSKAAPQRIVQTGVEFERTIPRAQVVLGQAEGQYTGTFPFFSSQTYRICKM